MYTETYCQSDAFVLFEMGIQGSYRLYDAQTSPYCSVGVIFMGVGIAEVHQQSIAQELCNVSVKTLDDFRTSGLIGTYHVSVHFWVELRREFRGVHEVTKHDGELPTFSVR